MNFQKIVIIVALIILILMLTLIGMTLHLNKGTSLKFPPVVSDCPDFWVATKNAKGQTVCTNPQNLGDCKEPKTFDHDHYLGHMGDCRKSQWAKRCNITWQGFTNKSDICEHNLIS